MKSVRGRRGLVTGASGGLGPAITADWSLKRRAGRAGTNRTSRDVDDVRVAGQA